MHLKKLNIKRKPKTLDPGTLNFPQWSIGMKLFNNLFQHPKLMNQPVIIELKEIKRNFNFI